MGYAANEKLYLELIRQFLDYKVDVETFCERFRSLWKADRDEEWSKRDAWSERYDIQLTEAYNRGDITGEEFQQKWRELFDSESYENLSAMIDRIFTACDVYQVEPEAEYEIDELELRREVAEHLAAYKALKTKKRL